MHDTVISIGITPGTDPDVLKHTRQLVDIQSAVDSIVNVVPQATDSITSRVEERLNQFAADLTERIADSVHNLDIEVVQSRTVFGPQPVRVASQPTPVREGRSVRPGTVHPAVVPMPQALPGKTVGSPLPAKRKA